MSWPGCHGVASRQPWVLIRMGAANAFSHSIR